MTEEEKRMHRCCFTGHRTEMLSQPDNIIISDLEKEIRRAAEDGFNVFISGMARGVDIWAAEIVLKLRKTDPNIKLICAGPYEDFEKLWGNDWQQRYKINYGNR